MRNCPQRRQPTSGQHRGVAKGAHEVQRPPARVGTTVRSTCQTLLGAVVVISVFDLGLAGGFGGETGGSLSIRPTELQARDRPARPSVCAILSFPMRGQRVLSRWTRYRTKSGSLLTGSGVSTNSHSPSSSTRSVQLEMLVQLTRNLLAVSFADQPRRARSSRIWSRSAGV